MHSKKDNNSSAAGTETYTCSFGRKIEYTEKVLMDNLILIEMRMAGSNEGMRPKHKGVFSR